MELTSFERDVPAGKQGPAKALSARPMAPFRRAGVAA